MDTPIVTRIAPSPTGHLHIGTVRTALYNYLYARKYGGSFIVRIEDTDAKRSTEAYEKEIYEGFKRLGLASDAYYRQSERSKIYRKHLTTLVDNGHAYISHEESREHPGVMIDIIRLRNPNTTITFTDAVRGEISFDTTELGDMVIARSIDDPLYHFAVVVDDHEMGVTHIIRGDDHISNTPRQILIQEALGFERPVYVHLPLILAADRSKLSKRHGAVSLHTYLDEGFLEPALLNYLALLGWNPGTERELFTLEELVHAFDLEGIQKGGAIFDREKLLWFNREHLKLLPETEFKTRALEQLPKSITASPQFSEDRFMRLLPTIRERTGIFSDIARDAEAGEYDFAFSRPHIEPALLKWKKDDSPKDAAPRLEKVCQLLAGMPEQPSPESIKTVLWPYAEEAGRGEVLWPLRVALTGKERSPDPFTVISIIGIEESLARIENARGRIG